MYVRCVVQRFYSNNNKYNLQGITFSNFTLHMTAGTILLLVQTYFQIRFNFRNIRDLSLKESCEVQEIRHEINMWQRAAVSMSAYGRDHGRIQSMIKNKIKILDDKLNQTMADADVESLDDFEGTLKELRQKVSRIFCTYTYLICATTCLRNVPAPFCSIRFVIQIC